MSQHNSLQPLLQSDIFLAPGSYFHTEYSNIYYHELPKALQKLHNQRLIRQYSLSWPNDKTLLLPASIAHAWCKLGKVALGLGIILHKAPLPWWGELAIYSDLRERFSDPLWQINHSKTPTPQTLLTLGAEQLFAYITPFGREYTKRLKYMFSAAVLQLIPSSTQTILPWNIVEETCHYVRKNIA